MSGVLTWVLVTCFVVWLLSLWWSLWLLGKWGYLLAIGSTAAISISMGLDIILSPEQSESFALLAPAIMFLAFYYFVTVQYLTGKEILDMKEFPFFWDDIRRKRRPTLHEWTAVIAGWAAFVLVLTGGGIAVYRIGWG